ncbi:Hsp70 family protein [Solihabitans fulvus]|uniref:Hsp70 family protein n=1 Tax=Solihabitans fulvus TaxID=1892852 RepID=A0A5B2WTA0_9PSEU|nr:Hsp70 family protein [Solihabitans fulvus]KAA2254825.1 Hsp70 family protein [Solihabitans fulvus]
MRVLSVDLGTSNTVAVLSAHGRQPRVVEVDGSATMPSAVFAEDGGGLVVGRDAERRARLDPSRFEPNPKRRVDDGALLLGESVVPVTDALAAVLARVLGETTRQLGGAAPEEVRLTHPAQWGSMRRNVLLSAARLAGMGGNLVLVPEPVAAAAHFASFLDQPLAAGQALAVYDLGAGTFDVAIVGATQDGFAVLAEDGLADLGGLDVDQALLEHVGRQVSNRDPAHWQRLLRPESTADRRARRALLEDVRAAKEALSRHPQTEVPMPEPFDDVLVTRTELEALIRPSLLRSVELLAATIRSIGMAPENLAGIYLVGGASRIPLVATLISERLRVVPTSLDQPETAVALGAHHVPSEGASHRTRDFAVPPPTAAETTDSMPAISGGYTNPHTGGFTIPGTQAYPGTGPQPMQQPVPQFNFPSVSPQPAARPAAVKAKKKNSNRTVLIALASVVVLALAAFGAVLFLRNGNGVPTATECKDQTGKDDKGFTKCLRQLAGAVADRDNCQAGSTAGVAGVTLKGISVNCNVGSGYTVQYVLTDTVTAAQESATAVVTSNRSNVVKANWSGNGFDGEYRASADSGIGFLVFTVKDRPLVGIMTKVDSSGAKSMTPDALADYFEHNVQPGT